MITGADKKPPECPAEALTNLMCFAVRDWGLNKQRILAHTLVHLAAVFQVPLTDLVPDQDHITVEKSVEAIQKELHEKLEGDLDEEKRKSLAARLGAKLSGEQR